MARFRGSRSIRSLKALGVYGTLTAACLISTFPIVWGILTSFKVNQAIFAYPPRWIPDPGTLEHYRAVMGPIGRYMLNSAFIAAAVILLTLVIAAHGAYAASRGDFPLKRPILLVILASMMIPGVAVLIPLYWVASKLDLFNTYTVLIVIYTAWMVPMALWFLRGFFETVPRDLEDAATMDGCSKLGTLYRIVTPLVVPGLAAVSIVVFIFVWNEFIIALSMTTSESRRVLTVGIYYYITAYGIEWGKLMAAVSLALAPILIGFFVLQRGFIQGMTAGATRV
jgi:ABC-type glycerol-3-phosphate transport system permease component